MSKRFLLVPVAVLCLAARTTVHACPSNHGPCGPPPPSNQLYGFITANTTLTYASPGPVYEVLGDVVVSPSVTLAIEPGVTLRIFPRDTLQGGEYPTKTEFDVRGSLVAIASSTDSIWMIPDDGNANSWGQVRVAPGGAIQLEYVAVRGALRAFNISSTVASSIRRCSISGCTDGIYSQDGTVTLQAYEVNGTWTGQSNSSVGILAGPNVSMAPVDSLAVIPTMVWGFRWGVQSGAAQNVVVYGCEWGFYGGSAYYCTAVGNSYGFQYSTVINSIAAQGGRGITSCNYANYVDSWSNAYNNYEFTTLGPQTASFDPFFVNPQARDYRLADNSIFKHYSNSGGEIGAYGPGTCPSPTTDVQAPATRNLLVSPNPVTGQTWKIDFAMARTGDARLEAFDATGRRVWETTWSGLSEGFHSVSVETPLARGMYWLRLTTGAQRFKGMFVVAK